MMDQASLYRTIAELRQPARSSPALMTHLVIQLTVAPQQVVAWRVSNASELLVMDARLWLTRAGSLGDFWLMPGERLQLRAGERIWLSTDDNHPALVSLTCPYIGLRARLLRWLSRH